jgi:putative colanic acid biosynthesis UDP-glucose lipid carrier transferase
LKQLFRTPTFLKVIMHLSEILWVNFYLWLFFHDRLMPGSNALTEVTAGYGLVAILLSVCYLCGIWLSPMSFYYRTTRAGSVIRTVFLAQTFSFLLFLLVLLAFRRVEVFQTWRTVWLWGCTCLTLIFWRFCAKWTMRWLRSVGFNIHYVLLVGEQSGIIELSHEMADPCHGYRVLGYFNDRPVEGFAKGVGYLGTIDQVLPYLDTHRVDHLYCGLPSQREADILPILGYCEHHCVRFFSVPDIRGYLKRVMGLELFGRVPLLYVREDPLSQFDNRLLKRLFDIVFAGLFMIPFWLLIFPVVGIIIKVTSPGPVFFKQKRNGLNGRIFYCYKFRSMKVNADADKQQATANDPRKTKFGNFLRKSSIDELPQFINVLKGEMSVVGPRPHMVKHTVEYSAIIDKYMVRHWVKPGITGWAQVNGARGETQYRRQMEDRIEKDVWYIENWSFGLDIKIILMTIYNGIRGDKQAY